MNFLYTAEQSREIDRAATSVMALDGLTLMQRAARFAWQELLQAYPDAASVTVWCGKGNNAGDAYLVAQHAAQFGLQVNVLAVAPLQSLTGDARRAADAALASGVHVQGWSPGDEIPQADVQVDGLLGTGVRGAPRPDFAAAIVGLNKQGVPVLSIDVPSD